ncbi:MAG: CRISPR system precrRNA processing endoribonuclease RAMP protein Cas6 [Candidatus Sericytochromatia bacterium]|nr:CRISPR system precrRNA processing endoribonuclease RAMP protein Cas6 [Candidatus Sericytochromatia bacterium]
MDQRALSERGQSVLQGINSQLRTLSWRTFDIQLLAQKAGRLPGSLDPLLRAAFQQAFKDAVCLVEHRQCNGCLLQHSCSFPRVFMSPVPKQLRQDKAPLPFVMLPPEQVPRQLRLDLLLPFRVRIFGQALSWLPYFLLAWERLARNGLGPERTPFVLETVSSEGQQVYRPGQCDALALLENQNPAFVAIPPFPGHCRLQTLSPLRLQPEPDSELPFARLVAALLQRLNSLLLVCQGQPLEGDFELIVQWASTLQARQQQLVWQDFQHGSRGQSQLGGLNGWLDYGPEIAAFWPLLWLGQYVHIGRGTSFGLGRYHLTGAENGT